MRPNVVLQAARFHGVLPAFTPGDRDLLAIAARQTAETVQITRLLTSRNLAHLFYKGVTLALEVYGDVAARSSGDIDLLIRPEDLEQVLAVLAEIGYRPVPMLGRAQLQAHRRGCNEISLCRAGGSYELDLHWRVAPPGVPCPSTADLLGRAGRLELGVPVLSPEDRLLVLAVHGCHSCWEKIRWTVDVERCLERPLDRGVVQRRARELGCQTMLALALALAADDQREPLVRQTAQRWRGCQSPGAWQRALYVLRTLGGWNRISYVARLLLTPRDVDYACVNLPRALFPLYSLVRLGRLRSPEQARRRRVQERQRAAL